VTLHTENVAKLYYGFMIFIFVVVLLLFRPVDDLFQPPDFIRLAVALSDL